MNRLLSVAAVFGLLLALTTTAGAADEKKKKKKEKGKAPEAVALFTKLDANGDGKLSKDEFGKLKQVMADSPAKKKKKADK